MEWTRRAILATAGTSIAVGLAGCGGDGSDGDDEDGAGTGAGPTATPEAEDTQTESDVAMVETIVDERIHLREDNYESWQFYLDEESTTEYEFTETNGIEIDVYIVEHRQLSPFESEVAFDSVAESEAITSDAISTELPTGTYHLIVDHSSRGRTTPPGGLGQDPVDVEITATYRPVE